jgi:hypothetical protein
VSPYLLKATAVLQSRTSQALAIAISFENHSAAVVEVAARSYRLVAGSGLWQLEGPFTSGPLERAVGRGLAFASKLAFKVEAFALKFHFEVLSKRFQLCLCSPKALDYSGYPL